ncbi:metallophosphoesterase family protein [Bacillus sp. FJAT-22090]|uniref:metallophosphoesterase family protein n=1 Tax=Bacillus sp. FJAT-22090 TaxID=1581038 RepID=UPI0011A28AF6|nr:metallophosphoesterase [Bacillus sp. FJAT-22090]
MKLLIISDTHRDTVTMEKVLNYWTDIDTVIHCGDSELDASYFDNRPIHIVRGNCDFGEDFPEEVVLELESEKVLVVHGHKHHVKTTLMPLNYRAQEVKVTLVCFGHSHMLGAELQNGILFVNPGSLNKPRGRKEKSYAIVEKLENAWAVVFYSSEHILIDKIILKVS